MTKFALLNNVEHQNLKVMSGHSETLGDGVMYAMTYPAELRNVQAYYPVLFIEDGSGGGLLPIALFGFEKGETCFWTATAGMPDTSPKYLETALSHWISRRGGKPNTGSFH